MPRLLLALGLAVAAAACASPYTPKPDRPFEEIPEFTARGTVTLTNSQSSTEGVEIGGGMIANLKEWTDIAILIAEREIGERGATIGPGGDKSLSLALTRVEYSVGWVTIETQIDMEVATGSGYRRTYTGRNSSAMMANPPRQVDGAMMRVVKEMLVDPEIVAYLR